MTEDPDPEVLATLVDNHRRFLEFLERRTGSRAEAEDLLQAAFVRTLERGGSIRSQESAVAWFYRLLRNALTDRHRAERARERRAKLEPLEGDPPAEVEDPDLRAEACRCVLDLLPTLKPEYARLLQRVDLEGEAVRDVAQALGITPNNAGVRLHRARKALWRQVMRSCRTCATHGCADCSCGGPRTGIPAEV